MERTSRSDVGRGTWDVPIESVVVVGRGAIGSLYCDKFARAEGVNLRVAVDQSRIERYRAEKFLFNGEELVLDYFVPTAGQAKADLIIIATKWDGYREALDMIEPLMGDDTLILPLLNGLLPYHIAEERYGQSRVMMSYYIGHTASREGSVAHQDGAYRTVLGEKINQKDTCSERLQRVIDLFERAGVKYRVDRDMEYSRWLKFVINLGLNQTSALDGGLNYGQIRASKRYREICTQLMEEGVRVAQKMGVDNALQILVEASKLLDTLPDADYSSMAQDIRAGRVTEWEIFGGYLLDLARKLNLELPQHNKIKELVMSKQKGNEKMVF